MKKRVEIVMLPTEKADFPNPTILKYNHIFGEKHSKLTLETAPIRTAYVPQHLYFISDDEIKDRDWCYDNLLGLVFQFEIGEANSDFIKKHIKKIIATTNEELGYGDEFGGFYQLARPSKEFLKKFCELNGIWEVEVEYVIYSNKVGSSSNGEGVINGLNSRVKVAPDNTISIYPV